MPNAAMKEIPVSDIIEAPAEPAPTPASDYAERALVPAQENRAAVVPDTLLSAIVDIARTPGLSRETLALLLDRQKEMEAGQKEAAFWEAMNACQAEIAPVARTADNTQTRSKYAKLEHVDAAIRPIYVKYGFSLTFSQVAPEVAGNIRIKCVCGHTAGHREEYFLEAPADTLGPKGAPTKTALHGLGSTDTYLRRYLECGVFNVVLRDMDDDGQTAGQSLITEAQAMEIEALIVKTKSDRPRFMEAYGVENLLEMTEAMRIDALGKLHAKQDHQKALQEPDHG